MYKRLRSTLCIFIMLLAAAAAWCDMSLSLSAPKSNYLIGEPLYVVLEVKNTGKSDAAFIRFLEPKAGLVGFEITAPDGKTRRYDSPVTVDGSMETLREAVVKLEPGKGYTASIDLTFEKGFGKCLLTQPGEYKLRAVYSVGSKMPVPACSLKSNELVLKVAEPADVDKGAYDLLLKADANSVWSAFPQHESTYRKLIKDYPKSAYALYARYYLAQALEVKGLIVSRGSAGSRRVLTEAAELYEKVARDAGETPFGVEARMLAGRACARLGQNAQAEELMKSASRSAAATDEDRLEAASWMAHVKSGLFQRESGLLGQ